MANYTYDDPENDALERAISESSALRKAALSPQGQMVGRVYVRKSPWQNLAEGLAGGALAGQAEAQRKALLEGRQKAEQGYISDVTNAINARSNNYTLPEDQQGPVGNVPKPLDQYNREVQTAMIKGANLPHSQLARSMANYALQHAITAPEREYQKAQDAEARKEQLTMQAEARQAQLEAQAEQKREAAEAQRVFQASQNELYRRTVADQEAAQARREALAERRLGLTLSQIEAKNAKPSAAQVKEEKANQAKEAAGVRAGSLLDDMETQIDVLDINKDIPNSQRGVLSNVASYVQGTGLGQTVGKALGTRSQTARNNIQNIATNLVLELKGLKGMSASQMNSNMELQRYLSAVGGGEITDASSMRDAIKRARGLLGAAGSTNAAPAGGPRSFANEAEATAAGVKPGDKVIINGVAGTWR